MRPPIVYPRLNQRQFTVNQRQKRRISASILPSAQTQKTEHKNVRQPRGITYPEAMNALRMARSILTALLSSPRPPAGGRQQLRLLLDQLNRLLARDNSRTR